MAIMMLPASAFAAEGGFVSAELAPGKIQAQVEEGAVYASDEWEVVYANGSVLINRYTGSDTDVVIPDSAVLDGSTFKVTEILEDAFWDTDVIRVTIPSTIKYIDPYAFDSASNLQQIIGAAGLKQIDDYAFRNCTKLSSFPFGSELEYIGEGAFQGSKISEGSYPRYLTKIETGAFVKFTAKLKVKGKENYKYAFQVLSKVNKERKKRGLSSLVMDKDLMRAAMQRAAETALVFSHARPIGMNCFTIEDKMSGENIAFGQKSPSSAMSSWMHSPGHKANILHKRFNSIGIGCFVVNGKYYWVQAFGYDKATKASKPKNKTATHTVIYNSAAGKLKFKIKAGKVKKGKKASAKVVCINNCGLPVTIQPSSFKFSSSKPKVAKISAKGKITGKKRGKAKITAIAKAGTLKLSKTVKVK